MRLILSCVWATLSAAVSFDMESCDIVDSMRESGEYLEEPDLYREYIGECIAEIDQILDVSNWTEYMDDMLSDIFENFRGYHIYDDQDPSYHDRMNAERQLSDSTWREKLEEIVLGGDSNDRLVRDLTDYYTEGYGSALIEKSMKKHALCLGQEIEAEKARLRLKKESMELELDPRRRSARIAETKRKRISESTLSY